jgi:hypothetical protein
MITEEDVKFDSDPSAKYCRKNTDRLDCDASDDCRQESDTHQVEMDLLEKTHGELLARRVRAN